LFKYDALLSWANHAGSAAFSHRWAEAAPVTQTADPGSLKVAAIAMVIGLLLMASISAQFESLVHAVKLLVRISLGLVMTIGALVLVAVVIGRLLTRT